MKNILLFLSLQLIFFSCQQKKADPDKAKRFAVIIYNSTHFEIKAIQQEFANKMAEAMISLQENNSASIDTKNLRELLGKAKQANHSSLIEINKVEEIDNEINLKQRAIDENQLMKSLYENEFLKVIEIMEGKEPNKFELATKLFDTKVEEVKRIQQATRDADDDFSKKYNLSFSKDSVRQ